MSNNNNRPNNNKNNRYNRSGNQRNNRYNNNSKTPNQQQNETTPTSNRVDIVTEQIISPMIVKPVLSAEDWDICLANVEYHEKIITIGNKIRTITKSCQITIKTTTQFPHSNKIL